MLHFRSSGGCSLHLHHYMARNHTKWFLAELACCCSNALMLSWKRPSGVRKSVSRLRSFSSQGDGHVPGGGHPEEHLWSALHRERTVEDVRNGRALKSWLLIHCVSPSPTKCFTLGWWVVRDVASAVCVRNIPTKRKRFEDVCKTGSLDQDKRLFVWVSAPVQLGSLVSHSWMFGVTVYRVSVSPQGWPGGGGGVLQEWLHARELHLWAGLQFGLNQLFCRLMM